MQCPSSRRFVVVSFLMLSLSLVCRAAPSLIGVESLTTPDTLIIVRFDGPMDPAGLTDATIIVSGSTSGVHTGTYTYKAPLWEVAIDPDVDFDHGETVTVTVGTGVMDAAGEPLPAEETRDFEIEQPQGTEIRWKAAVDGNWTDATKWDLNRAPTAGDTVIVDAVGSDYTVTLNADASVRSVRFNSANATLSMSGNTLTTDGASTWSAGRIRGNDGSWEGNGTITCDGTVSITRTLTIRSPFLQAGTLTIQGGDVSNHAHAIYRRGIWNQGILRLTSLHSSYWSQVRVTGGPLRNAPTGTLDLPAGAGNSCYIPAAIINEGTWNVGCSNFKLTDAGRIYTNGGTVSIAAGKTLEVEGGDQTFRHVGGTIAGTGTFRMDGDDRNERLEWFGGSIECPTVIDNTAILFGPDAGPGTLVCNHTNSMYRDIPAGVTVVIEASSQFGPANMYAYGGGFANRGTIVLRTTNSSYVPVLHVPTGIMVNAPEGVLTFSNAGGGTRRFFGDLDNEGTVNVNNSLTVTGTDATYVNRGTFLIAAGKDFRVEGGNQTFHQEDGVLQMDGAFAFDGDGSGETFRYTGGDITGIPDIESAGLEFGPALTRRSVTVRARGTCRLLSDVPAPVTLLVQADGSAGNATLTSADGFANDGTIRLTTSNYSYYPSLNIASGTLLNRGMLLFQSGTARAVLGAELRNEGEVTVSGTTRFAKEGASHANAGTFTVTTDSSAALESTACDRFVQESGTLTVGRQIEINGGGQDLVIAGGTVDVAGKLWLNGTGSGERFHFSGGEVNGTVLVDGSAISFGDFTRAEGDVTVEVNGTCTLDTDVPVGATLIIKGNSSQGSATLTSATGFENAGRIVLTDNNGSYYSKLSVTDGVVTNAATGLIDILPGSNGNRYLDASVVNLGTWNVDTDLDLTRSGASYENTSTVVIATGVELEVAGGDQTFHQAGGLLQIDGTFVVDGDGSGETFRYTGGSITGTPQLYSAEVEFGPALTRGAATVQVFETGKLLSDVPAAITLIIQGGSNGGTATLNSAAGFTNDGLIRLTTNNYSYGSVLNVASGTFLNRGLLQMQTGSATARLGAELRNEGEVIITGEAEFRKAGAQHVNAGTFTVTHDSNADLALTDGVGFTQESGTLTVERTFEIRRNTQDLTITGGMVEITGKLWLNGSGGSVFSYSGGTVSGRVSVDNAALNFPQAGREGGAVTVDVGGVCTLESDIPAGVTLILEANSDTGTAQLTSVKSFENSGQIILTDTNSLYSTHLKVNNGELVNTPSGVLDVRQGAGARKYLSCSIKNAGTWNVETNLTMGRQSAVYENSGTLTIAAGKNLKIAAADQSFYQNDGTLQIGGVFEMDGDGNGELFKYAGGTIVGVPQVGGTSLEFDSSLTRAEATIRVVETCRLLTDVPSPLTLIVEGNSAQGSAALVSPTGFENAGQIVLTDTNYNYSSTLETADRKPVLNSGVLRVDAVGGGDRYIKAAVTNSGQLTVEQTVTVDGRLSNSGGVFIAAGKKLTVATDVTQDAGETVLNGATIEAPAGVTLTGGMLKGAGTVDGNLTNGGTVSPGASAGVINVTGDYVQEPAGTIAFEIGGAGSGDRDRLSVTGSANLDGAVDVSLIDGFTPSAGQAFSFISAAARTGETAITPGFLAGFVPVFEGGPTTAAVRFDAPSLTLEFSSANLPEGSGRRGTLQATVTRNSPSDAALPLTLSADPDDQVELPDGIEIPIGEAGVTFDVATIDETDDDGDVAVTLTAGAAGHTPAEAVLTVLDDDITLTVDTVGNGSTDPPGTTVVDTDDMPFPVQATADPGWQFTHWSGDTDALLDETAAQTTLQTLQDVSIAANFRQLLAIETVSPGTGTGLGTDQVTVADQADVDEANTLSFAVTVQGGAGPYQYAWQADGQAAGENAPAFDYAPDYTVVAHPNRTTDVTVICTVTDSETRASATVTWTVVRISDVDREPEPAEVSFAPSEPRTGDSIVAAVVTPAEDPDGDPMTAADFRWLLPDGREEIVGDTLLPEKTKKGDVVTLLRIVQTDPYEDGGKVETEVANVPVTIMNTAPEAVPQPNAQTTAGTDLDLELTGIDPDVDEGVDDLTFNLEDDPEQGALLDFDPLAGTVTYRPAANFTGTDQFSFTVNDGDDTSAPATVSILVHDGWVATMTVNNGSEPVVIQVGTSADATDGVDAGFDRLPDGRDGSAYLLAPDEVTRMVRDIRGQTARNEWVLVLEVDQDGGLLAWDATSIPDSGLFIWPIASRADVGLETIIDMRVTDQLDVPAGAGEVRFGIAETVFFEHELSPGWNALAFPLEPTLTSPEDLLAMMNEVQPGRGSRDAQHMWERRNRAYTPAMKATSLVGYWIYLETAATLILEGALPIHDGTEVEPGWNQICFPKDGILPDWVSVREPLWRWHSGTQSFVAILPGEEILAGIVYWAYANATDTLYLQQ